MEDCHHQEQFVSQQMQQVPVTKFLRIGLADKNDHPPFFEQSLYEVELEEDEAVNQTLLTLTAKDLDEASRMYYEMVEGNEDGTFAVGNLTGEVYLARPLDYEKKKKYELRLLVSDGRHESDASIVVHVRDVNDNPPLFDRHLYETEIEEEDDRDLPKHILTVTVTDGDYDRPEDIVFSLSGEGIDVENPQESHFQIMSSTGEVFVRKALDRDHPQGRPSWGLTVFAQDEGGTGLVSYSEIVVKLKDINDNAPIFPQSMYYGNITENGNYGEEVITMKAEDYDDPLRGANAQLTYFIEKNVIDEETAKPIFLIEPETGVVRTAACCLDREKTPDYLIQVVAVDGGGLKGTGTASITVLDINDKPPKFTKENWSVETEETSYNFSPPKPILTVSVHDEDEDNMFSYRVVDNSGSGADKFSMITNDDGTGSLVVMKPLDFEDPRQVRGFKFQIEVSDAGEEGLNEGYHTATSWVVVKLKDINDNMPKFLKPNAEVRVFENTPVGRSLTRVAATDADMRGQSKISYAIVRKTDRKRQFHIDSLGTLTIQRPLDREVDSYHMIKVMAIDNGIPPRTATSTLTVVVLDINDNAPTILEDYRPLLPENQSPRKFAEILARDNDDPLKNNGPPFQFRMGFSASKNIKSSFRVENVPEGSNGEGIAMIFSLRKFDREVQKEYLIPIVIKDSGVPPMIGTSTLTVEIGDDNDNSMKSGTKDILFYSYKGRAHDTQLGRVYTQDPDDWDFDDKKFTWKSHPHPNFYLDEYTGMITMKYATSERSYNLNFHVQDDKHRQSQIAANVTVKVRHVPGVAVENAGSIRVEGITGEEFISNWDYKARIPVLSMADKFREKIATVLDVKAYNIHLFSIQLKQTNPPITDVFFSVYDSGYLKPEKLNGFIMQHKKEIEKDVGISIVMSGIDECLFENMHCEGSCTNRIEVLNSPHLIDVNMVSFVGVQIKIIPECVCKARDFSKKMSCRPNPCHNNGQCVEGEYSVQCQCPEGYNGPRCQILSRTFQGNGFIWLAPLQPCEQSHLSVEFQSIESEGLILYNGPLSSPKLNDQLVTDFIGLELENGKLRLLINFGSGTLQLKVNSTEPMNDGHWHRADIYWGKEVVRIDVDQCKDVRLSGDDSTIDKSMDLSMCQAEGTVPPFNEYLNVNSPLQVGGLMHPIFLEEQHKKETVLLGKPFQGCIRNLMMNGEFYDFAEPGFQKNSDLGCLYFDRTCASNSTVSGCGPNGICDGSITEPMCLCNPGWTGPYCEEATVPAYFESESYVKYVLSFQPDPFHTSIQLRFRTWEINGELFRLSDQHNQKFGILEINDKLVQFRYNLDRLSPDERFLCLSHVVVNDGEWHFVMVERYGATVTLMIDGGEGRFYNETSAPVSSHMLLDVDKQEGISAGGRIENTGSNTVTIHSDYQLGCMDDIRIDGKPLPLPPALSGTQWAQASVFQNLATQCVSPNQCLNATCVAPLICKDLWMRHECGCPDGTILSKDHRVCLDEDECLSSPCKNGGMCYNQQSSYICDCPDGYVGNDCEIDQDTGSLQSSLPALAAIIICLLFVFALVVIILIYLRRRRQRPSADDKEKTTPETSVKYEDKAEGEVTILDLTALSVPSVPAIVNGGNLISRCEGEPACSGITNVDVVVCRNQRLSQISPPKPPDGYDMRGYTHEGGGMTHGSISSLGTVGHHVLLTPQGNRQQRTNC